MHAALSWGTLPTNQSILLAGGVNIPCAQEQNSASEEKGTQLRSVPLIIATICSICVLAIFFNQGDSAHSQVSTAYLGSSSTIKKTTEQSQVKLAMQSESLHQEPQLRGRLGAVVTQQDVALTTSSLIPQQPKIHQTKKTARIPTPAAAMTQARVKERSHLSDKPMIFAGVAEVDEINLETTQHDRQAIKKSSPRQLYAPTTAAIPAPAAIADSALSMPMPESAGAAAQFSRVDPLSPRGRDAAATSPILVQ
jgi:hypothetical protein